MVVSQSLNEMKTDDILRSGHSIDDMLIHCSIDSRRCNSSVFTHFKSARFGNCYTLQADKFVATVPGPAYGLTLMLNLDVNDYVSPYSSGYGLKLLVHETGTHPFIEEHGVTLAPAWTFVSLKQKTINRLGHPHGNCDKHLEYKTKYGIVYTRMACEQICLVTLTKDICDCMTGFVSLDETIVTQTNKTCDGYKVLCSLMVLEAQVRGDLPCPCTNPCSETHYSTTISSLSWPHEEYLRNELIPLMCTEEIQAVKIKKATGYDCNEIRNGTANISLNTLNIDTLRNNFLKLDLYFEELSYEHIEEVPAYDSVQFLSDIGGTVGLFVGASVLSGVELIHLLVECFRYVLFRLRNK
ncbi:acid-sensing ion channel 4-A-like [Pecten maximus]|uniref:acid-sensing ion channel 4-A-like n=1 Tax=Pecten maximus TaxID=6579 RepID=UPI001458ACD5|nr:acid-sensing ion channel 4-A-like [Pecten maximus]